MGVTKQAHKPAKTAATKSRTREWLPRAAKSKAKGKVAVSEDEDEEGQFDEEEAPKPKSKRTTKSTVQARRGRQTKQTRPTKSARQTKQTLKGKKTKQPRQTVQPEVEDDDSDDASDDDSESDLDDDSDDTDEDVDPEAADGMLSIQGALAEMTQALTRRPGSKPSAPICSTCFIPQEEKDMMKSSELPTSCRDCYRNICRGCMENYLDRYFFQATSDTKGVSARCPFCRSEWEIPRIEKILGKDKVNIYLERMTHRTLETSPAFRWCAADRCTSGQFYVLEEQLKDGNVKICCGVCESVNCYECRTPWHEGLSCKENQDPDLRKHRNKRAGDAETTKVMRKVETRRCPSCGIAVEKTSGCDHVFCECTNFVSG